MRFARSSMRAAPAILLVIGVLGGCVQHPVPPLRPPSPAPTRVTPLPAAPRRVESTPSGPSVAPASVPVPAARELPEMKASTGNRSPHTPATPPAGARLAPVARSHVPASPPHVTASPPPVRAAPPAHAGTLDLKSLEQRLRDTHAIGLFTKLSLKNQVDDLLAQFQARYSGQSHASMADLHQRYDLLLMKVLSLLQGSDPPLAADIAASRGAIWVILSDPKKFAKAQL
jgi:hypothetical protein